ncbi:hypothetical protein BO94DRAFT_279277 [Aspergillus sclerotioniger CBS 115572]|uniref:Uncharacterized protein n=1 Tax=Aspergillus sclerotioniger CBS 115572 TaxID=1450535 RepID=A0A317XCB0_9EURO|nr:hypothetical protein BO94DRAFT_279277 [Aspergillus sclerotioniger CBS 115572]PWY94598.1 hypothetical protein BO94DRAFT_279277 [Aspergillus sclerotioniger CBS 115572]
MTSNGVVLSRCPQWRKIPSNMMRCNSDDRHGSRQPRKCFPNPSWSRRSVLPTYLLALISTSTMLVHFMGPAWVHTYTRWANGTRLLLTNGWIPEVGTGNCRCMYCASLSDTRVDHVQ